MLQSGPCYGAEAGAWPGGWQQAKGPPPPGPASALLQGLRQAVLNPGSPAQPPAGVGAAVLIVLLALLRAHNCARLPHSRPLTDCAVGVAVLLHPRLVCGDGASAPRSGSGAAASSGSAAGFAAVLAAAAAAAAAAAETATTAAKSARVSPASAAALSERCADLAGSAPGHTRAARRRCHPCCLMALCARSWHAHHSNRRDPRCVISRLVGPATLCCRPRDSEGAARLAAPPRSAGFVAEDTGGPGKPSTTRPALLRRVPPHAALQLPHVSIGSTIACLISAAAACTDTQPTAEVADSHLRPYPRLVSCDGASTGVALFSIGAVLRL